VKVLLLMALFIVGPVALAQDVVKPIPPAGRELAPADRAELEAGIEKLGKEIAGHPDLSQCGAVSLDLSRAD
jgi:hypothetical protein